MRKRKKEPKVFKDSVIMRIWKFTILKGTYKEELDKCVKNIIDLEKKLEHTEQLIHFGVNIDNYKNEIIQDQKELLQAKNDIIGKLREELNTR